MNDMLTIAGCMLVAGLVAYNGFAQRMASAGRSPSVWCFLGMHRWKPLLRPGWTTFPITGVRIARSGPGWLDFGWRQVGRKCTCCGKRNERGKRDARL